MHWLVKTVRGTVKLLNNALHMYTNFMQQTRMRPNTRSPDSVLKFVAEDLKNLT
jgi:hypothetical protein